MLRNYLKTAFRSLLKNKFTTAINLFGLSVGMTAAVFIFIWVQNEHSFDNYHPSNQYIYRITNTINLGTNNDTWKWETSPYNLGEFALKEIPGIKNLTRCGNVNSSHNIIYKNRIIPEKNCAYVDSNWFSVFKYDFVYGDPSAFNNNNYAVAITESKAKKYFGTANPIGNILKIDTLNYTVEAVVKDNPLNSSFQFDIMMQMGSHITQPRVAKNIHSWGNFNFPTYVLLQDNANVQKVTGMLNAIMNREREKNSANTTLQPLSTMHFETDLQSTSLPHGNRKTTYIFSVLGILLLLTACINYVNLTTAKASLRSKEVGIKKIIGAGRKHLFMQFIVESFLISIVSLLLSLLFIQLLLPVFNSITEKQFVLTLFSFTMWKILLSTLIVATILNGIYPAIMLSSFKPIEVFRGKTILKLNDAFVRKSLVVFQFSLSVILIIGSIVIFKQLKHIQNSNPGYNLSQVVSMEIPYNAYRKLNDEQQEHFFAAIRHELLNSGAVEGLTMGGDQIINVGNFSSGNVDWDGHDTAFQATVSPYSADADFQKVFQLQMKEGRWFHEGKEDEHNYILNESALRMFNMHTPVIGQRFTMGGDTGKVVGIVKDFHYQSMHEKIGALVMKYNNGYDSYIFLKAAAGKIPAALQAAATTWKKFIPSEPFEYTFMDESFDRLYKEDRKISSLVFIFSIIAVVIAALGLFGLAAFTTEIRTKEIGIRKVLGAGVQSIVFLLSKDFIKLALLAFVIASPIAWYFANKWLEDFAYRIDISWWIFAITVVLAMIITIVTVSSHAIKAAISSPVNNLRSE
ncbi:MAG: ABC transporter permease [Bacteroidetes bacterium]|nr:ABC transporter permease [Bacteroidota bacterium]